MPAVMSLIGTSTYVQVTATQPSMFFNFVPEMVRDYFVEIPGSLMTTEVRSVLIAISGFYLGSGVEARR